MDGQAEHNAVRLTLIRTPGTRGGYPDQSTQDIGRHEFVYGIAGHAGDWRRTEIDWQGQRLNDPLIAFESSKHTGALGREFSLLKVNNPRIRVMALKKSEHGDEVIVRLVELDGKPQPDVRVSFAAPIESAREMDGQEQLMGPATATGGELVTSFTAYRPRTFAVKLGALPTNVAGVRSAPVALQYDIATASNDGTRWKAVSMARAMRCRRRCCPSRSPSMACISNSLRRRPVRPMQWSPGDKRSISRRTV